MTGYNNPYQYQPWPYSQPARQSMPGRIVSNADAITPNEVPMDGSISLFPLSDYSAIYAKSWNRDGTISTVRYVPEVQDKQEQNDVLEGIIKRLEALEELMK